MLLLSAMKRISVLLLASGVLACAEVTPGEFLISELNCVACHEPTDAVKARLASRPAPLLGPNGVKATPQWLREFLADPQKTKPGTLMPDMMHSLPAERKAEAVEGLTHFLASIQGAPARVAANASETRMAEGKALYHSIGCVQCHAPFTAPDGKDEEMAKLAASSVPLAGPAIKKKYSMGELAAFLTDPLKSRTGGRMPALNLTSSEAESIAMYLLREQLPAAGQSNGGARMLPSGDAPFVVDQAKAGIGAQYFVMLQCGNCHAGTPNPYTVSNTAPVARKFAELRPRQPSGCLATAPKAGIPKFDLTDRQKTVIIAALKSPEILELPLTEEQHIRRTMTVLNCFACHARDRRGGINGLHREYLATVGDVDMGDEGKVPPHLNGAGAKLRPEWLRDVLLKGGKVRPYMALRMPVFGKDNVAHLPALFEKADVAADAFAAPVGVVGNAETDAKWGRKLTGTTGLSCVACHDFAGRKSPGIPGLDLAQTGQRLRFDWFRRYLLDPQSLRAGTRMPPFWPAGVAVNKDVLNGDTEAQIRALWLYFSQPVFVNLPDGLVQEK